VLVDLRQTHDGQWPGRRCYLTNISGQWITLASAAVATRIWFIFIGGCAVGARWVRRERPLDKEITTRNTDLDPDQRRAKKVTVRSLG
jgi:hypothetical protein